MDFRAEEPILFLGIGGSGMSGLAYLLSQQGYEVKGVDQDSTVRLPSPLVLLSEEEAMASLSSFQAVIHTDAAPKDHPLLVAATTQNIPIYPYHAALGMFAHDYKVLAVTGAHGKSSTSAFLAHILVEAGLDPTVLIGAPVVDWKRKGARFGRGEYFVVEADEYREHFLTLSPLVAVITTIDFDHPDFFHSLKDVEDAYSRFLQRVSSEGGVVVLQSEYDKRGAEFWPRTTTPVKDDKALSLSSPIPGEHMKRNAALAVAAAEMVGIGREKAMAALQTFGGLGRRFEKIGTFLEKPIFSDYGHHPAEIAATITGMREKFPDQKLVVVFEAHMIERLQTFFDDFAQALATADGVIICPVFYPKGREGTSLGLVPKLQEELEKKAKKVWVIESYDQLQSTLAAALPEFDVACAFTAGVLDGKMRSIL